MKVRNRTSVPVLIVCLACALSFSQNDVPVQFRVNMRVKILESTFHVGTDWVRVVGSFNN